MARPSKPEPTPEEWAIVDATLAAETHGHGVRLAAIRLTQHRINGRVSLSAAEVDRLTVRKSWLAVRLRQRSTQTLVPSNNSSVHQPSEPTMDTPRPQTTLEQPTRDPERDTAKSEGIVAGVNPSGEVPSIVNQEVTDAAGSQAERTAFLGREPLPAVRRRSETMTDPVCCREWNLWPGEPDCSCVCHPRAKAIRENGLGQANGCA